MPLPQDCPTLLDQARLQQAQVLQQQHGVTHVTLSFGARNGGAYFARWLRYQIMQRRGWHQVNSVYLDTECLKMVPNTVSTVVDAARPWLVGVASMNGGWKEYYRHAVATSQTMIFVATPEWSNSPFCNMERRYFIYENARRRRQNLPPLRGIVLAMDGHHINIPGAITIDASKVDVETHYQERHQVTHRANPAAAARFGVVLRQTNLPQNHNYLGNYTIAGQPLLRLFNNLA
ncbi:hypothetical protein [Gallaecimonas xiamenensis]|uniref:Uncharacterized protein n=1 Tax=Gallaecimonas xiamenensis 3-C-1 TaxID=745411 RepID=K2J258_9GAMM|nr:hypothetical protein [Gallaecimonas xiamenensis]EKE69143.1 hypothetical protein B3C1_15879 [Gallaecimonas xiamenensis 3-C-1]